MTPLRRLLIIDILLLLGEAALIAFAVPDIVRVTSLSKELTEERGHLASIAKSTSSYKRNAQAVSGVRREIPNFEVPSQNGRSEIVFFTTLERFAKEAEVEQTINLKAGKSAVLDFFEYPFEIKISGTYPDFLRYLQKIEEFPAIISIESIVVSGIHNDISRATSEVTLTGSVRLRKTL